jgi:hypothetical protein
MKIFLSWSGDRSRAVATALRDWLPSVIQSVRPWISSTDIDKGSRWAGDIALQLQESSIGIICVTPENFGSPWLLFESGALSKSLGASVCTFLLDLAPSDLPFPLAMFQTTEATKEEMRKLLHTINKALGAVALSAQQLDEAIEMWWFRLEASLSEARAMAQHAKVQRPDRELLEELISIGRAQLAQSEQLLMSSGTRLAVLAGTYHKPPMEGDLRGIGPIESLGRFETQTIVHHGAPSDYAASHRFDWHGVVPPPDVSWAYSKEQLDWLLAGGRIMMMNGFPVLRLFEGDRAALERRFERRTVSGAGTGAAPEGQG